MYSVTYWWASVKQAPWWPLSALLPVFQVNVATQCDPEEVIILSDSEWPLTPHWPATLLLASGSGVFLLIVLVWCFGKKRETFFFFWVQRLWNCQYESNLIKSLPSQDEENWIQYLESLNYMLTHNKGLELLLFFFHLIFEWKLLKQEMIFDKSRVQEPLVSGFGAVNNYRFYFLVWTHVWTDLSRQAVGLDGTLKTWTAL